MKFTIVLSLRRLLLAFLGIFRLIVLRTGEIGIDILRNGSFRLGVGPMGELGIDRLGVELTGLILTDHHTAIADGTHQCPSVITEFELGLKKILLF